MPIQPPSNGIQERIDSLDKLLGDGRTDDEGLLAELGLLSRLILANKSACAEYLHAALRAGSADAKLLPFLILFRALCGDPEAAADVEACGASQDDGIACAAVKALVLWASRPLDSRVDEVPAIRDFWIGSLMDMELGERLRPGFTSRLIASGAATEEAISTGHSPLGRTWDLAFASPGDPRVRAALLGVARDGRSDAGRLLAMTILDSGADLDAVARDIIQVGRASSLVRAVAVESLSADRSNRKVVLSVLSTEGESRVLQGAVVKLLHVTDSSTMSETVAALEEVANRAANDDALASRIALTLSALDNPQSVVSLASLAHQGPSHLLKLYALAALGSCAESSPTITARVEAIAMSLWEVDPADSNAAAACFLKVSLLKSAGPAVRRLLQGGVGNRIRENAAWSGSPMMRQALLDRLAALEHELR